MKILILAALLMPAFSLRAEDAKPAAAQAAPASPAPAPPSSEELRVTDPASAKFTPATTPGLPPGVQISLIGVDPVTKGSVAFARIPGGSHLKMHWHSQAEYSVLVAGHATFTLDGKKYELAAGSYSVVPPKIHHELVCAAGADCVLLTRRAGPADYNWVAP